MYRPDGTQFLEWSTSSIRKLTQLSKLLRKLGSEGDRVVAVDRVEGKVREWHVKE